MDSANTKEINGANIKRLREKKKLTQEEVSKKADMGVNYYARIERGEHQTSPGNLLKIAKALSVDISELFKKVK